MLLKYIFLIHINEALRLLSRQMLWNIFLATIHKISPGNGPEPKDIL